MQERRIAVPPEAWSRLPEPDDELEDAARAYYGAEALPVAGTQAAIQALPRLRARGRVGVIGPTYAEHAQCWRACGHLVIELDAESCTQRLDAFDVLVLVQPNNPDGARISRSQILDWHARLSARGGWLVLDEAYVDARPQDSLARDAGRAGLLVLRSPGKFFGLAGARVGFVLGDAVLRQRLRETLGPWTLAGPSRWVATAALRDEPWHAAQRARLADASGRLHEQLTQAGLAPQGGCALFQWTRTPRAAQLHEQLAAQGILTRHFAQPSGLRFGLPGHEPDWQRLRAALMDLRALAA